MPQYYDREDFYKLADVEKYLGYKLCKDRKHYLNRNHLEMMEHMIGFYGLDKDICDLVNQELTENYV